MAINVQDIKNIHMPFLDPFTKKLADQEHQRAINYQDVADNRLDGVDQSEQLRAAQAGTAQRNLALDTANSDQVAQALAKRSQRSYDQDLKRLQNQVAASPQTDMRGFNLQSRALGRAAQDEALNMASYQRFHDVVAQREAARRQARNSVIGSIIGVGGMIAGAAIAGPAGAAIGGALGGAMAPSSGAPSPVSFGSGGYQSRLGKIG